MVSLDYSGRRGCSARRLPFAVLLGTELPSAVCVSGIWAAAHRRRLDRPARRFLEQRLEKISKKRRETERKKSRCEGIFAPSIRLRHLATSWYTSKAGSFPVPPLAPDTCIASQTPYHLEASLSSILAFPLSLIFHLLRRQEARKRGPIQPVSEAAALAACCSDTAGWSSFQLIAPSPLCSRQYSP